MKTSFKMVAMLLGIGIFPLCAHAQKKVIIEDEEPNSIMFVSKNKAGDEIIRIMNDRSQMPASCSPTRKGNSPWASEDMFVQQQSMTLTVS